MAKRPKKKAPKAMKASKASSPKASALSKGVGVAKSVMGLGGGKAKGGARRRHKKSALWYAKEIQRMKLKRRYEKVKMGLVR